MTRCSSQCQVEVKSEKTSFFLSQKWALPARLSSAKWRQETFVWSLINAKCSREQRSEDLGPSTQISEAAASDPRSGTGGGTAALWIHVMNKSGGEQQRRCACLRSCWVPAAPLTVVSPLAAFGERRPSFSFGFPKCFLSGDEAVGARRVQITRRVQTTRRV